MKTNRDVSRLHIPEMRLLWIVVK